MNASHRLPTPSHPSVLLLGLVLASCASGPALDLKPHFFPPEPAPPRIQFLLSVDEAEDVEGAPSGMERFVFGSDDDEVRRIGRPFGCAYHDGAFYVTDSKLGAILRLDFKSKKITFPKLTGKGLLKKPLCLRFADDGTVYVADGVRRVVVVYDKDFHCTKVLGPFSEKSRPIGVAVHGDKVYIADSGDRVLRILDRKTDKELAVLGKKVELGYPLTGPTSVDVDKNGYIYVSDTVLCRIFVWNDKHEFLRYIGEPGDAVGRFARPKGIAVSGNTVFALDAAFENCQIFDFTGEPLLFFGGSGAFPGAMYLPANVWVGTEGLDSFRDRIAPDFQAEKLIMVTSQFGPKVSFYALGKSKTAEYKPDKLPDRPVALTTEERAKILEAIEKIRK